MKQLWDWWHTTCERCRRIRQIMLDTAKLAGWVLAVFLLACSFMFFYWLFLDTSPAVIYGSSGWVEFRGESMIVHVDATRMRDCTTEIRRKIGGACGQINVDDSFASAPVGEHAGPVILEANILFKAKTPEQLSGNICYFMSRAESFCNPLQRAFNWPLVAESRIDINPAPRAMTFGDGAYGP